MEGQDRQKDRQDETGISVNRLYPTHLTHCSDVTRKRSQRT